MKNMVKNKVSLLVNILLPSLLCLLLAHLIMFCNKFINNPEYLWPSALGLVLGIFNYKHYKYKIFFLRVFQVTLISFCVSLLCFYISMMLIPIISLTLNYMIELLSSEYTNGLHLRMSVKNHFSNMYEVYSLYIVSPITVIWFFSYIFNFPKTKFTKVTILAFLVLFPIVGFSLETVDTLDPLQILLWMPLMILPIQLILNQEDIKALFITKKG